MLLLASQNIISTSSAGLNGLYGGLQIITSNLLTTFSNYDVGNMKYLGVDWGMIKIGLAISEGEIASPWGTVIVQKNSLSKAVAKVVAIAKQEEANQMVIGKPEGEMGQVVEKAVNALQKQGLNVVLTDETLSTQNAKSKMLELGFGRKARKEDNAMAAAIILQRYLDEKQ